MPRRIRSRVIADRSIIGEINTTPLIDVMLVLLILCIISVPMMQHKVTIRLPGSRPPVTVTQPQTYRLALNADRTLSWNGQPTSLAALSHQLEAVERNPDSVLEITASGDAPYEDYDRMLVVVKRSGVDRISLAGNEAFTSELDR